jgi:hypothetical protein
LLGDKKTALGRREREREREGKRGHWASTPVIILEFLMPAFFLSFFFFDSIYSPHFLLSDYL